jgi:hypothetical protein
MNKQTETEAQAVKVRAQFLAQCARCNPHAVAHYVPSRPDPEARAAGLHNASYQPELHEIVWAHLEAHPDAWADMLRIFLRASTGQPVSGDARWFVVDLSNKIAGANE